MVQPENPLVQKPETLKLNEFLKETVFFCIFCSRDWNFMFSQLVKILNRKYEKWPDVEFFAYHSRILALTEKAWKDAVQGHKSNGRWKIAGHRYFCDSREVFNLEMLKMICDDLVMGGRAEILKVWLYFRVWYAVGAKIVRWRYRQVLKLQWSLHVLYTVMPLSHRFLIHTVCFFLLNLQGNPFTIISLSFFKLTVCAHRYNHRRISKWSRLSTAGLERLTAEREVAGSISGAGPILRVLK